MTGDDCSPYIDISYPELKALLEGSPSLLLIDVRSKEEVDRGKIPGSINIPVDSVESELALDTASFQAKYGVPKPPADAPDLIFHCQMGRRGAAATQKAWPLGFNKARNYVGGYKEWSEKEAK
ncbi:TSTD1 sulfurtransferase, partial [Amia calva]|nr:TSTD1 sulfurtransferase [Amia calva]